MADISGESVNITNIRQSTGILSTPEDGETGICEACGLAACGRWAPPGLSPAAPPEPFDCLAVALFCLMVDSGLACPPAQSPRLSVMPLSWRTAVGCSADFTLPGLSDCTCKLVILKLGDIMLVNTTINEPITTYSLCVPLSKFSTPKSLCRSSPIMKDLIISFKDNIATPTRSTLLTNKGIPSASLIGLPEELLLRVMRYSGAVASACMAQTCRRLAAAVQDDMLWKSFYCQKYQLQVTPEKPPYLTWYNKYKNNITKRNSYSHQRLELVLGTPWRAKTLHRCFTSD